MSQKVLDRLLAELEAGRIAALVSVISFRGSVPRKDYPRTLFVDAGHQIGTVGGGCVDGFARRLAAQVLAEGGTLRRGQDLDNDDAEESGLVCGGHLELEARRYDPTEEDIARARALLDDPAFSAPRLLVMGGGHVGLATARFATQVGWVVTVLDDRDTYSNPERFPFAEACLVGPIDAAYPWLPAAASDALVIATRGHAHDLEGLAWASRTHAGYVGLLGSIRKRQLILDKLAELGAPVDTLEGRFHSPVGAAIGALTADEIGLSVAAQLVAFRRAALE
jgi:xanthine dehydrogenase accessory factor